MTAALVLRTEDPAIGPWHERVVALRDERHAAVEAFLDDVTRALGESYDAMELRGTIIGLAPHGDAPPQSAGWRENSLGVLVPHLGRKAGKEWAKRIGAIPRFSLRELGEDIGIPSMVLTGMRFLEPGMGMDKDEDGRVTAVYQTWASEGALEDVLAASVRTGIDWTVIPLSVWYAREEAKQ